METPADIASCPVGTTLYAVWTEGEPVEEEPETEDVTEETTADGTGDVTEPETQDGTQAEETTAADGSTETTN